MDLTGLHVVKSARPGKPVRWYVYAWRAGPCIHIQQGGQRPRALPAEAEAALLEARQSIGAARAGSQLALVQAYRAGPEWQRLAPATRRRWTPFLDSFADRFGTGPERALDDLRSRGLLLAWRDRWRDRPRTADFAIEAVSAMLGWAVMRGRLRTNALAGVPRLYRADRSKIIWTPAEIEAFCAVATPELGWVLRLATLTGLRRADLISLEWADVGDLAIIKRTSKSRGRRAAAIPLLPQTRALLAEIPRRAPTVLTSSRGLPWTADGLETSFTRTRARLRVDGQPVTKRLHDARGTLATHAAQAGLSDEVIARILTWAPDDVAQIRERYVDNSAVVVALAERLGNAAVKQPVKQPAKRAQKNVTTR